MTLCTYAIVSEAGVRVLTISSLTIVGTNYYYYKIVKYKIVKCDSVS